MASTVRSLLKKGQAFLTPTGSSSDLRSTARPTVTTLFPCVNPAIDGPDCLHDCDTCTIRYPAKFSVEQKDVLYGHVNGWATHLLVATGKKDWGRNNVGEKGSVMEAVGKWKIKQTNERGICYL